MALPPLLTELLGHPRATLEGGSHLLLGCNAGEGVEQLFDVADTDSHRATEKLRVDSLSLFSLQGGSHHVKQVLVGRLHQLLPFGEDRGIIPPLKALDRLVRFVP